MQDEDGGEKKIQIVGLTATASPHKMTMFSVRAKLHRLQSYLAAGNKRLETKLPNEMGKPPRIAMQQHRVCVEQV